MQKCPDTSEMDMGCCVRQFLGTIVTASRGSQRAGQRGRRAPKARGALYSSEDDREHDEVNAIVRQPSEGHPGSVSAG